MFSRSFVLVGLLAASAIANANGPPVHRCNNPEPSGEHLQDALQMAHEEQSGLRSSYGYDDIVVDIVFHVVAASKKLEDGWVSDKTIKAQLAVLNDDFAPSGISFNHVNTTRTVNKHWADHRSKAADLKMKRTLRQGTYKTLNMYIMRSLGGPGGAYGECSYPLKNRPGSFIFINDGCLIYFQTMPGGSAPHSGLGKAATHEVGHWFHLDHTFGGGCGTRGDTIADTPAQKSPSHGCPKGRDSCPGKPGKDPIHNYMDYSDESCQREFTPGQTTRMIHAWEKFRADA